MRVFVLVSLIATTSSPAGYAQKDATPGGCPVPAAADSARQNSLLQQAYRFFEGGSVSAAGSIAAIRQAVKLAPLRVEQWQAPRAMFSSWSVPDTALAIARLVNDRWPECVDSGLILMNALLMARDSSAALAVALSLPERFPESAIAWAEAGGLLSVSGKVEKAKRYFDRYYELEPDPGPSSEPPPFVAESGTTCLAAPPSDLYPLGMDSGSVGEHGAWLLLSQKRDSEDGSRRLAFALDHNGSVQYGVWWLTGDTVHASLSDQFTTSRLALRRVDGFLMGSGDGTTSQLDETGLWHSDGWSARFARISCSSVPEIRSW
ncbi:MAG: hypothetical protein AB7I33_10315 [Gemmatimonadales bacterium]